MNKQSCTRTWKRIIRIFMTCLVFSMTLFSIGIGIGYSINDNWWDNDYLFRKDISVTNSGASSLSDFVVFLNISAESGMQVDYDDLRFVSGNCIGSSNSVFLDYEIEYYDASRAVVWMKIPSFGVGVNNICMYYGDSSVGSGAAVSSDVWSDNYGIVYHMESAGNDFSPNNNDKIGNTGVPVQGTDWLGYKETYDGDDAWNQVNLAYWEVGWDVRTHEVVFETSADVTTRQAIFAEGGGTNGVLLYILSGQLYARWWSESTGFAGGHVNTGVSANTKYYVSMSYEYPGEYNLYVNGIKINGVATSATMNAHSGDGGIAYTQSSKDFHDMAGSGYYFMGEIHEFFVRDVADSDDFIAVRDSNFMDHSSFASYDVEEGWLPTISPSITSPNPSSIYFIEQDNVTTVQAQINCVGPVSTTCSTVSSKLEIHTGGGIFADVSTVSAIPAWTSSSLIQNCLLDGGDNCVVSWVLNITDVPLSTNMFRIISDSSNVLYSDVFSENLTVKVLDLYAVSFNYTNYNFPSFEKLSGDRSLNVDVKADKGDNTNVQVSCISGDCANIVDDFVDGIGLSQPATSSFSFTCLDSAWGSFSTVYRVVSDEFPTGTDISLSCDVIPLYGPIAASINYPSTVGVTDVGKDVLFKFNSTIDCNGLCGEVSAYLVYESAFGDFSDGDLTVSASDTIVNSYDYLVGDENNLDNDITINDASSFAIGDEILIWQVQNGSGTGVAGTYEFSLITNKIGNVLTIGSGIKNNYSSGSFDMVSASVTQVVRVPNYEDVIVNSGASIIAKTWDGYSGGIVAFRSSSLVTNGDIDVSAKGFRGGDCNTCANNMWGDQGEGYLGTGIASLSANGNGGGGGYGPAAVNGEPGAGGGLGTSGVNGISSYTSFGGNSVGDIDINSLFMGGGAGAGGDDDYTGTQIRAQYIDGAGVVLVFSQNIINLSILANGEDGIGEGGSAGVTGGGAGGTVWISSENLDVDTISAVGGAGFVDSDDTGGDGGVGRIRLDYVAVSGSAANPVPGKIGSLSDVFNIMPTFAGSIPFYTINSQPQTCNPVEDGSCDFVWMVNATGDVNFTSKLNVIGVSNLSVIASVYGPSPATVRIFNSLPEIFILNPMNNSKFIGEGEFSFIFNATDLDDGVLTCRLFLDGVNFENASCNDGSTQVVNYSVSYGVHNWSVSVTDSKSATYDTGAYWFNYLQGNHLKVSKSVENVGTNIYDVEVDVVNYMNYTNNVIVPDFVTSGFNIGSVSPFFDFTNLTSGFYTGDVNVWNVSVIADSVFSIGYALTNVGGAKVGDNFVVGLE